MLDWDQARHQIVHDLYRWGPALTSEIRARFPPEALQDLLLLGVMARRKFTGFNVYVLTGKGLRRYGYTHRYNYVPARTTVVGALIRRAKAREYSENGYSVQAYEGYSPKGRGNIALAIKDDVTVAIVSRPSLTKKTLVAIAIHLAEHAPQVKAIEVFLLPGDHDPSLNNVDTAAGLPVTISEVSLQSATKYPAQPGATEEEGEDG